jgi:transaldolase / glucose-6-phosphate isomerase
VHAGGFSHVLLLGMGGSSMCPEVLAMTFGRQAGYPELHVLDSTDPSQVKAFEQKVDLKKTLFIVASKSGGTLEPNALKQYFHERVKQALGAREAGRQFLAITDPGSKMQQVAETGGFRKVFFGESSIGGRYSALSSFGMVPAAAMGLDVEKLLTSARQMMTACLPRVPAKDNPGVALGVALGTLANAGRDKVTVIASPGLHDLGAWLEQLVAESTGKIGKALIPVDREALAAPEAYGGDRMFVYLRFTPRPDSEQDAALDALAQAGQPIVRMDIADAYDIGQEFFRWEIATAVAGAIIQVNPFDQPDVEASKVETRKLTDEFERTGILPRETPILEERGIALFADTRNAAQLRASASETSLVEYLRAHLGRLRPGDYFGILAYIEMDARHQSALQRIRHAVRDKLRNATCVGFGPRFLHSTGQAYKGGPNSGVFLQITCDDAIDLPVPGQKYTFGIVKAAQARGDFQVLADRERRALRAHLGRHLNVELEALVRAVEEALRDG